MPINLQVNGVEYTNFTDASVSVALDTLSNDFTFTATLPAGQNLPFKGGESCTIVVDDELVMTGFIENVTGTYTAGSHVIIVSGRDKTADVLDSSINIMDDIRAPVTLKQIIEKVIEHIGADIAVVDAASPEPFNKAEDIVAPQPGDNAFQFIEGYAQKRQVLLTSNAEGNIVITNSEATPSGGVLQNALGGNSNNIVASSWAYLANGLYNKYIQKGQLDPVALSFGGSTSSDGVVSQQGEAVDDSIRAGRQLVTTPDKGFSQAQLQSRAEWSKKIRQGRSVSYSCDTQGFQNSAGALWTVNTLVSIFDDFADIDRDLLLNSIQFSYSGRGSISLLTFVEADAYELQLNEPKPVGSNQDSFIL